MFAMNQKLKYHIKQARVTLSFKEEKLRCHHYICHLDVEVPRQYPVIRMLEKSVDLPETDRHPGHARHEKRADAAIM